MIPFWALATLQAFSVLAVTADIAPPASLSFIQQHCPGRCSDAGAKQAKWSLYQSFSQLSECPQTLFHSFSLFDPVDSLEIKHKIYSCTNYGSDWDAIEDSIASDALPSSSNATFDIALSNNAQSKPQDVISAVDARSILRQMSHYFAGSHTDNHSRGSSVYASANGTSVGIYIGSSLDSRSLTQAINLMGDYVAAANKTATHAVMQMCEDKNFASHSFAIVINGNGTFGSMQDTFKQLVEGQCASIKSDDSYPLPVSYYSKASYDDAPQNKTLSLQGNSTLRVGRSNYSLLHTRGECTIKRVPENKGCPEMADMCGISPHDFDQYNSAPGFCSSLRPGQPVCCSPGTMPDVRPKPFNNGTCFFTNVHQHDSCGSLAAYNGLTLDELKGFNEHTWGWTNCDPLYAESVICLSSGHPPPPPIVANAVCGPQAADGTDYSSPNFVDWNPCPLKACCDIWGQCGTTEDFCTDTNTGPPGTAKPGTNGCISNCGTDIKPSAIGSSNFRTVGYFEGFNLNRKCLFQDASQIDADRYTHIHFAFGLITPDFTVDLGDALTKFQFQQFIRMRAGPKKILSFGGWVFSTSPSTYHIFRDGMTDANRNTLARNIAQFILDYDLDGVDIDWEYPGAQDIPGIPPASKDDGKNFLAFLRRLRGYIPDKSISIAAASSFWYLRGFPIEEISSVVDYIIYMTYDLHGQWDSNNKWSQIGCPSGRCLRSDVNLTETLSALSMITKAGVPSDKVVVGITSYGRSHGMADGNCHGPDCFFTGGPLDSTATPGPCTDTAGYISNAEIYDILKAPSRVKLSYVDEDSGTNILVYDDNQWVGYMDETTRRHRTAIYKFLGMGGTTNWAIDLEGYNDVPQKYWPDGQASSTSWSNVKATAVSGSEPNAVRGGRTGNWSHMKCTDPGIKGVLDYTSEDRWNMLDTADAWLDGIAEFKKEDLGRDVPIAISLANTYHDVDRFHCEDMPNQECTIGSDCQKFEAEGTGPAAMFIHNSLVAVHMGYKQMADIIVQAMSLNINPSLDTFMDTFAPIPIDDATDKWVNFIIDMISTVATIGFSTVFNSYLSSLSAFKAGNRGNNFKDIGNGFIGGIINVAKDFKDSNGQKFGWTPEKQNEFKQFIGNASSGWFNMTEQALKELFDGSDNSIDRLTRLTSDGKMIEGMPIDNKYHQEVTFNPQRARQDFTKVLFGYVIPAVWRVSQHQVFVLDAGVACDAPLPVSTHLSPDTASQTKVCYEDRQYYLVMPPNEPNEKCYQGCHKDPCPPPVCKPNAFTTPVGIDVLNDKNNRFGGITKELLVIGSVRTFKANGANSGQPLDFVNNKAEDIFMNLDMTMPNFIRLPVCDGETAHKTWSTEDPFGSKWPCPDKS